MSSPNGSNDVNGNADKSESVSPFVSPNTKKNVDGVVSDMVHQIGQANGDAPVEQPNLDDSVGLSVSNGSMTDPGSATLPDESAHEPSPPPQPIVDADSTDESQGTPEIAEPEEEETAQVPMADGAAKGDDENSEIPAAVHDVHVGSVENIEELDEATDAVAEPIEPVVDEPADDVTQQGDDLEETSADDSQSPAEEVTDDDETEADKTAVEPQVEFAESPEKGAEQEDNEAEDIEEEAEKTAEEIETVADKTAEEPEAMDDGEEHIDDVTQQSIKEVDESVTSMDKTQDDVENEERAEDVTQASIVDGQTEGEEIEQETTAGDLNATAVEPTAVAEEPTAKDAEEGDEPAKMDVGEVKNDVENNDSSSADGEGMEIDTAVVEKEEETVEEKPSNRRRSSRSSATPAVDTSTTSRRSTRGSATTQATPKETTAASKSEPATEPGPMGRRSSKRQAVAPPQTDPKKARVGQLQEEGADTPKRGRSKRQASTPSEVDEVEESSPAPKSGRGRKSGAKTPVKAAPKEEEVKDEYAYEEPPAFEAQLGVHGQVQYKPIGETGRSKYSLASKHGTPKTPATPDVKARTSLAGGSSQKKTEVRASPKPVVEKAPTPKATPARSQSRSSRSTPKSSSRSLPPPPEMPSLSADQQVDADLAHREHHQLAVGCRVYALYGREHYPAVIITRVDVNSYMVVFVQDEVEKKCPRGSIIPLSELAPGHTLDATMADDEDEQHTVTIVEAPEAESVDKWMAAEFKCTDSVTEEERTVPWSLFMVAKTQTNQFKDCFKDETSTDVNSTAVVEGRRSRRSVAAAPQPDFDDEIVAAPRRTKTPAKAARSTASKTPTKSATKSTTKSATKTSASKMPTPPSSSGGDWKAGLDARLANCDKEMFKGMLVVLTSSTNREKDPSMLPDETQPFVKREVKYLINALSGQFIENVGVDDPDTKQALLEGRVYCVTDTYYRTTKYLLSLAAGAIIISHKWVLDCVAQGKELPKDDYFLPAGADFDSGKEVKQVIGEKLVRRESPFGSVRVVFEDGHLYSTWKPILAATGGKHLMETPEEKDTSTAQVYAVADDDTKADFLKRCRALGIPLLTSEWLIACLIHNKCISPKDNARFTFTNESV